MRTFFICLLIALFIQVTQAPVYAAPAPVPPSVEHHIQSLIPDDVLAMLSPELLMDNLFKDYSGVAIWGMVLSGLVVGGIILLGFLRAYLVLGFTFETALNVFILLPLGSVFIWALLVYPALPYFFEGKFSNAWEHAFYSILLAIGVAIFTAIMIPLANAGPGLTGIGFFLLAILGWLVGIIAQIGLFIHSSTTAKKVGRQENPKKLKKSKPEPESNMGNEKIKLNPAY